MHILHLFPQAIKPYNHSKRQSEINSTNIEKETDMNLIRRKKLQIIIN